MTTTDVAKVCHEANKALCEGLGDNSQLAWESASPEEQMAVTTAVQNQLNNPATTAEDVHNAWCQKMFAAGYYYGPVKDETLKEDPALVHYNKLPADAQAKSNLFITIVNQLSALVPKPGQA